MMQPADSRQSDHSRVLRGSRLHGAPFRCALRQSVMTAVTIVILDVCAQQPHRVTRIEDHNVVQQLSPAIPNPALDHAVLPGAAPGRAHRFDAERLDRGDHIGVENRVPIEDEVSRSGTVGEGFAQLLDDPLGRGMEGDIEVEQDSPSVVDEDQNVENLESDQRDDEEVHSHNGVPMVLEEGHPLLDLVRVGRLFGQISRHRALGNIEPQHEQFPVDAGCSPSRILRGHSQNQLSDFPIDLRSPWFSSFTGEGVPVMTESLSMPAHDRVGGHDDQSIAPIGPEPAQQHPECSVGVAQ